MNVEWKELSDEQKYQHIEKRIGDKVVRAGKSHNSIKHVRALRKSKSIAINNTYQVIIEGLSNIEAALRYKVDMHSLFICLDDIYSDYAKSMLYQASRYCENIYVVTKKVFELISAKDNSNGLLLVAHIKEQTLKNIEALKPDIVIILDGLETPGNIGSIMRTADAVNAGAVIITNRKTKLYHPMVVRSSRGACFKFPVVQSNIKEAIDFCIKNSYEIVLADTDADHYSHQHKYSSHVALVMGSERFGIGDEWYKPQHSKIAIPMYGDCDSLNVSVATSILLYQIRLQINKE